MSIPLLTPFHHLSKTSVPVIAPYDRKQIALVDCAEEEIIELSLTQAYRLFRDRSSWLSLPKRLEILEKAAYLLQEQHESFALEAAREGGKPLIDSRVEVTRAIDGIKLCIETMRMQAGNVIPMGATNASANRIAFTTKEPIGVVLAISAFNHPVNLIVHQVCPAIATGCPVIVKPATNTPLSCLRLVALFHAAGLPVEWCQALVIKENALAQKIASDPRVAFLSFIGSARVGWELRRTIAPGTRCSLEHGGVAPVIIAQDADLDTAIPILTKGSFYHAGQVCVSVQRIFAHESIATLVAEKLAEKANLLKIGDPTSPETDVGPLIRPEETDRIAAWVNEAVAKGATLCAGGKKISDSCYACTVLLNPPPDTNVSQHEVFGPVVCVYTYTDIQEAITRANSLPFAFQAAVFTKNLDTALLVGKNLDASAVMVNDSTTFRIDGMPFAGLRKSGLGVGGIPYTIHDMQIEKMVVIKSPAL